MRFQRALELRVEDFGGELAYSGEKRAIRLANVARIESEQPLEDQQVLQWLGL